MTTRTTKPRKARKVAPPMKVTYIYEPLPKEEEDALRLRVWTILLTDLNLTGPVQQREATA